VLGFGLRIGFRVSLDKSRFSSRDRVSVRDRVMIRCRIVVRD
jgi:hypothetical protein